MIRNINYGYHDIVIYNGTNMPAKLFDAHFGWSLKVFILMSARPKLRVPLKMQDNVFAKGRLIHFVGSCSCNSSLKEQLARKNIIATILLKF